jgi:serine/threonine-protein kinase
MTSFSSALPITSAFTSNPAKDFSYGQDLIGKIVGGKYCIQQVLGYGGMGVLYLAKHKFLDRLYAVKVIRVAGNPLTSPCVRRFRREAQTLAKMTHRNIVEVVDYDYLPDHTPFYVMEYLEGMDLASFMRHHPAGLPLPIFALLMRQLCDATGFIHKKEVIHRDLKPSNIMVNLQQNRFGLKILDFGLAGWTTGRGERLTLSGEIMGTPAYMAPEQCTRDEVSKQSDIYSLALIAYEMLTGRPAVSANNLISAVRLQIHGTPISLKDHNPDIPDHLIEAIEKALSKNPEDRFESISAFAQAMKLSQLMKSGSLSAVEHWPVTETTGGPGLRTNLSSLADFHAGETRTVSVPLARHKIKAAFMGGMILGAGLVELISGSL